MNTFKHLRTLLAVGAVLASGVVHASPSSDLFEQANEQFKNDRENPAAVQEVLQKLDQVIATADDADIKFQAIILSARAIYWQGINVPGSEENNSNKVPVFEHGYLVAKQAIDLYPDYADGYYFYALNLSRYGQARGKLASLNRLGELKNNLNAAMARVTFDGEEGARIDGSGPKRIYGRLYFSLPGIVGGDMSKSKEYLEDAVAKSPEMLLNTVYLAETLADSRSTRSRGKQMLADLIAKYKKDPASINADRLPEMKIEIEDAIRAFNKM